MNKPFSPVDDLLQSLKDWRVIVYLAISDVRARYRRSVLGPLWLSLGTGIGSVGLGFLWGALLKIDIKEFLPALTAGLILWQFIAGIVVESTSLFSRHASIIRNLNLPLSMHPLQLLLRHFINLLHNLPVFFAVALIIGVPLTKEMFLVVPYLLLVSVNLFWLSMAISVLGVRFRDLEYLLGVAIPILMFVSPVFYRPNYLPFSQEIIWLNPLSHLIEIVRDPLLGYSPPLLVVQVNLAMLFIGGFLSILLFSKKRNRIAYWI